MATLVLSTVGTVFGGPLGSAIGALIGQSIDQELLAPTRRGPRIGDLSVQSSSYGTQIPRIYGTMRVAGSVVWSTELIEHSQTSGAKGQADVTYSYTVSFAVALSSRRATSVGRIWADGKLLRGAAGDLKTGGRFRFYDGGEDQIIDPLIGSVEGIANTPAYRGVALAVFEDLQLADFGNRIPFLTFELEADETAPSLGTVLGDASGNVITIDFDQSLAGFAAYGRSVRDAIAPLIDSYGVEPFDDGTVLRAPTSFAPTTIVNADLGNSIDDQPQPRLQREQAQTRSMPSVLRLTYYDPDRDYQTGEARAFAGEETGNESQQELPAVMTAADAKSLALDVLARAWAARDKVTIRLAPNFIALEPGSRMDLPVMPSRWTVESVKIDGFVAVVQLRPTTASGAELAADPGRIVDNPDLTTGPVSLALIDVPNAMGTSAEGPVVLLAASSPGPGWKSGPAELSFGGQIISAQTARAKSLLGNAVSALAVSEADLIDERDSVEVQMVDADQWLTSCDDDALAAGANLAVLGSELIQFGVAVTLGDGRFRLSRLLRGRGGTEWACSDHAAGEIFCLLSAGTVQPMTLPIWSVGATIAASAASGSDVSIAFGGESLRPPAPVDLGAEIDAVGGLHVSWTRRSRLGFAWVDGIDAPLGETSEQYRVVLTGAGSELDYSVGQPSLTVSATDLATLGAGEIAIDVRQIGDFASSRPSQLNINPF
jgi:hypothetical protein